MELYSLTVHAQTKIELHLLVKVYVAMISILYVYSIYPMYEHNHLIIIFQCATMLSTVTCVEIYNYIYIGSIYSNCLHSTWMKPRLFCTFLLQNSYARSRESFTCTVTPLVGMPI